MDSNLTAVEAVDKLVAKAKTVTLPSDFMDKLDELFAQLKIAANSESSFWPLYQNEAKYIDWIVSLPWVDTSKDILDLQYASEKLNKEHYGLDSIKDRILEYIAILSLQKSRQPDLAPRAPIFLFSGLVGTGKTTMATSIAHALNREFVRIPFGGLGDPFYLRGRSRYQVAAEPGAIIKALKSAKTKNPVILLDEIDRVADDALNAVMGVLVELLDPEQNNHFVDYYIDFPFDLSQVTFCATCNNTNRIATAVLDRLEPLAMPSYSDEEKTIIGRDYLFPKAVADTGLTASEIQISPDIWPQIVRPLGFDAGVRTLKRNLEMLCRRVAYLIVSGQNKTISITSENLKQFINQW